MCNDDVVCDKKRRRGLPFFSGYYYYYYYCCLQQQFLILLSIGQLESAVFVRIFRTNVTLTTGATTIQQYVCVIYYAHPFLYGVYNNSYIIVVPQLKGLLTSPPHHR